ncbi:hypothetical protein [Salinimicrobium sp. GXAS 041]|uniref:hypothetical protein n=1 Tax=Salinimicrobium sp. GXAS 041 TaxID=3400806 RepID=UPI003C77E71F
MTKKLEQQTAIIDSLRNNLENDKEQQLFIIYFGKEFEEIENPEEFIVSELRNRPEVIPLDPVLGGTMKFRRVMLLSNEWIYAEYDDGHVQGMALYSYSLNQEGDLDFELVTSHHAGQ